MMVVAVTSTQMIMCVSTTLRTIASDEIANHLVFPNKITVPLMDQTGLSSLLFHMPKVRYAVSSVSRFADSVRDVMDGNLQYPEFQIPDTDVRTEDVLTIELSRLTRLPFYTV